MTAQPVITCTDCRVDIVIHDPDQPDGDTVLAVPGQIHSSDRAGSTLRVVLCPPHVTKYARQSAVPYTEDQP